jgi:hypothetical protein
VILSKEIIMNRFPRFRYQPDTQRRRPACVRLNLEFLEPRNLLNVTPTNVLVNNPAEDTTAQDTQSETAIVLGAKSNVVVAYQDDGGASASYLQLGGYSLSTNGGTSFTDEGNFPIGPSPYAGGSDPVLARSSKTGTIFLSSLTANLSLFVNSAQVNIFRSTDNGATFNTPMDASPGFVDGAEVADKPWMAVDNYPGPGYGNVYLAWSNFVVKNNGALTDNGIYLTRSTDDGQTWGPNGGVPIAVKSGSINVQGANVTVGPDHTVYVLWWNFNTSENILMSKSTDQGQTFSNPVIVTRLITNSSGGSLGDLGLTYSNTNNSGFRTNAFPQAAVNAVTGDIYVVYNDEPKGGTKDKADIFFTMSSDGGNTWSNPLRANDDTTTTDQWQPAIAVTPDGTHLFITWYDRRNDPTNDGLIDRYGVIGTISGHNVSFAPNFRLTNVSFLPAFNQDPFWGTSGYMSDFDMATADNNYFYTTWGDNRLSDAFFANQPDVRFAKIPVTGLQTDTALTAASSSLTLTASTATATASPSSGVIPSIGGATTNVITSQSQGSNGETGALPIDRFLTLLGNNFAFKVTPIALPGLVNEMPSLDSSLPSRFDALLSMGFNAHTLDAAQNNWMGDFLLVSVS